MINFFSKIRKKLAAENKVMAYLRYAIGEILLVVIGILIALQINNWNENRKKENEFRFSLKQLHETISIDQALMTSLRDIYTFQIMMVDSLLNGAQKIPDDQLPRIIQSLDYYGVDQLVRYSDQKFRESLIIYNPANELQNELAEQLFKYLQDLAYAFSMKSDSRYSFLTTDPLFEKYLVKLNIPLVTYAPGDRFTDFYSDTRYIFFNYKMNQISKVKNLLGDENFISDLFTTKQRKHGGILACDLSEKSSNLLLSLIEQYDPDIKLFFDELRIVGDATPLKSWADDIQMTPVDAEHMKWEIEIKLIDGFVKFKTDNNWSFNWGIGHNSDDKLIFNGPNIPVKAGHYKVFVDLNEQTYKFVPIKD